MASVTMRSSSESGFLVTHHDLEIRLNQLPQTVQQVFRERMANLNLQTYYFAKRTEEEFFHEPHRKEITTVYVMAPPLGGISFFPDKTSPFYTEVQGEKTIEAIPQIDPREAMDDASDGESILSFLQSLIAKIVKLIKNCFARLL